MTSDTAPATDTQNAASTPKPTVMVLVPPSNSPNPPRFDSLEALADQMALVAHQMVLHFAIKHEPLLKDQSAWIWLRRDGSIEAVLTDDDRPRSRGADRGSKLLEAFRCRKHATPASRYYRTIEDPKGQFICGSIVPGSTPRVWHRAAYRMQLDVLEGVYGGWQRVRIEPLPQPELEAEIRSLTTSDRIKNVIRCWIKSGHYTRTLDQLSFNAFKQVADPTREDLPSIFGQKAFFATATQRAKEALQSKTNRY